MMDYNVRGLKIDTCISVVEVGILKLNRNSAGLGSSQLA